MSEREWLRSTTDTFSFCDHCSNIVIVLCVGPTRRAQNIVDFFVEIVAADVLRFTVLLQILAVICDR